MPVNTARLSTALADRYRIERRLGEGGMATVYLAEDLKHKRKFAVKVLRPELAAGELIVVENFFEELKRKLGNDGRRTTVDRGRGGAGPLPDARCPGRRARAPGP